MILRKLKKMVAVTKSESGDIGKMMIDHVDFRTDVVYLNEPKYGQADIELDGTMMISSNYNINKGLIDEYYGRSIKSVFWEDE